MSDSFVGVFSLGAIAGMIIALVIGFFTVILMEKIDEPEEEIPEEDKDAEIKALAKKLNVKIGE